MKILLYIVILGAMFLIPVQRLDIAKLEPVEAVAVYMDGGEVVLQTDTQTVGRGATAAQALENLKENALAVIYLDTADYLLVGEGADKAAWELQKYLRPSVQIGSYNGGNVKEEATYLDVHGNAEKPAG